VTVKKNTTRPKKSYVYECEFEFFIGGVRRKRMVDKLGCIEITTDGLLTDEEIERLKVDELFTESIAADFNKFLSLKDAYKIFIKTIKLKEKKPKK